MKIFRILIFGLQGVPINMGIKGRLLQFFMTTIIAVFQFKHLISEAPGLEIFELWSNILYYKIDGNIGKFV